MSVKISFRSWWGAKNKSNLWTDKVLRKIKFLSKYLDEKEIIKIWNEKGEEGIDKCMMTYRPRPNIISPPKLFN